MPKQAIGLAIQKTYKFLIGRKLRDETGRIIAACGAKGKVLANYSRASQGFCLRQHGELLGLAAILIASSDLSAQGTATSSSVQKTPIDALIPWLLQEGDQLREIPFGEVIFDATGKHVLMFNPKDDIDARVIRRISTVLDEVMERLNAPDSVIQKIPRINEVSGYFEDLIRELLNTQPGFNCEFPKTAAGATQRSGYPDLELIDQQSHRIYYLDPKLYAAGSRESSFRTFYFEPRVATNKVREDAFHSWL